MALVDTTWYVNFGNGTSTGYYAVTVRPQNTAVAAGVLRRQFTAPAVGSERVFVCIVAGTTANVTDATWVTTRGAKTTDGTATWQECTGQAALNGDLTNTATWAQVKAATPAVLGQVIKRSNNASYQICTTAGAMSASEPAFSDTAGVTTTDTTAVWTSLGAVSNFTGGQAPHARLANALASTWFASGNTVYVGGNHAETQATANGIAPTSALMARIICHNQSGSYPPTTSDLATTATLTATGGNAISFTGLGSFYLYGLTFVASTNTVANSTLIGAASVPQVHNWYYLERCSIQCTGTAGSWIAFGTNNAASWSTVILDNCTIKTGAVGQTLIATFSQVYWKNTGQILAAGSSVPASLFGSAGGAFAGNLSTVVLEGLDLSQLTGNIFAQNTAIGSFTVKDCKLNAATVANTPVNNNTGLVMQLARSASGATPYVSSRHTYEAVETTETSIVRTGGFVDAAGQAQSRKIVTTANTQWLRPYAAQPLAAWNATTGSSRTVTVYGTVNSGTLPANDEVWLEVSGLTNASFPVGSVATTTKSNVLSAGSAGVSDSSTWTGWVMTWSQVDKTANITLSNSDLTATTTSSSSPGVRGLVGASTGKFYWEATMTTWGGTSTEIGLCTLSATLGTAVGHVVVIKNGNITIDGVASGSSLGARSSSNIIGVAVDISAALIWFRVAPSGNWNGSGTANPATATGGISIASMSGSVLFPAFGAASSGEAVTANFGGSAFSGAVPSGFASGWTVTPTPFKLVATLTPNMAGYLIPQVKVAKASSTIYIDPLAVVT